VDLWIAAGGGIVFAICAWIARWKNIGFGGDPLSRIKAFRIILVIQTASMIVPLTLAFKMFWVTILVGLGLILVPGLIWIPINVFRTRKKRKLLRMSRYLITGGKEGKPR